MNQTATSIKNHPSTNEVLETELSHIIGTLSLEEKVQMMAGRDFYQRFLTEDNHKFGLRVYEAGGGCEKIGLDTIRYSDGPRGVRLPFEPTCFPVSMARGASWDTDLERRVGEAMATEGRAFGLTILSNVCINLLRHPAWGRAQETYGEDPYHLGELGAALSEGTQKHNVMATAKHLAVNSIENARFKVNVKINERVLREVYLPHFKRVVDSGCASVMSAYNKINGDYCGHSRHLLRDILKDEWGFEGFVHSDWVKGVYGPDAAEAGLDIENPEAMWFGPNLINAVNEGTVQQSSIDDAVRRILRMQLRFKRSPDPREYSKADVVCDKHKSLAREAAEKGITLLKNNDAALPLSKNINKLALIGDLASISNLGDQGSSNVTPPYAITPLKGIKDYVEGDIDIIHSQSNIDQAVESATAADVAVIVVGYTFEDEGEYIPGNEALEGLDNEDEDLPDRGGDRTELGLKAEDEALIAAVTATGTKTIVCLMAGSAVIMENWRTLPDAIMMIWYPGMEGGTALARVLFGDVNPSGKLPFSIPKSSADLPLFDKDADEIEYDLYHGYSLLEKSKLEPAFEFGFGLSYTNFSYGEPTINVEDDVAYCQVTISNTGTIDGAEVAQLYVGFENSNIDRPNKLLRGFKRVEIATGDTKTVSFKVSKDDLLWYNEATSRWEFEAMAYKIYIGASSIEAQKRSMIANWS